MRMKYVNRIGLWMIAIALAGSSLLKADDIYLGQPGYGGNGCPQGSVSATLSPDSKQLSLLFDEFMVEAMGKKKLARKSCNIAIPIHIPQGLSVSIYQVDYRGYNGLPRGATSQLSAEYFFAGKSGPKMVRNFFGALDSDYLVTNRLVATALVWSGCGADVNMRINAAMRVRTNSKGDQALSTVDSVDLTSGLIYHLQWKRCW